MVKGGATYEETAKRFGISASRVGQIIAMVEPKINRADRRYPGVKTLLTCWAGLFQAFPGFCDEHGEVNGADLTEWISINRFEILEAIAKLED
jgi:hypothetical protein